ncbi:MAG: DUF1289 domain-containing protein [Sphingobium sp.]
MSIKSPCVRLCTLDDRDECVGCGRTLTEICGWMAMDEATKGETLIRAEERLNHRRITHPHVGSAA